MYLSFISRIPSNLSVSLGFEGMMQWHLCVPVPSFQLQQCTNCKESHFANLRNKDVKFVGEDGLTRVHRIEVNRAFLTHYPHEMGDPHVPNHSKKHHKRDVFCSQIFWVVVSNIFIFTPTRGKNPFWLIFFKWVETTN